MMVGAGGAGAGGGKETGGVAGAGGGGAGAAALGFEISPGNTAAAAGSSFAARGAKAARNGRIPSGFPNPS